ncbi:MAG: aldehyde dehydrogenase family protein, partial [Cyanobacteria bacterium J06648_11]
QEAKRWADACNVAKGVDPESPLAGDEWLAGPMAVARNLRLSIEALEADGQPKPAQVWQRQDGQNVAQVLPVSLLDRAVWLGYTAEVWIEPGQPASQGRIYREPQTTGRVTLVLGAGNISSIGPMDALYQLFVENSVVLLKFNPVNEYLHDVIAASFQPLIEAGFLALACGGAELGRHLCRHDLVDGIHITGSHHTHDAIAWGETQDERDRNKAANTPVIVKPITSELGCVTPVLVTPGEWSSADIRYQARQVASMVAHNGSFNCNAAKVVVLAKGWPQRQEFLQAVREELAKIPPRKAYYPGARDRFQNFLNRYPQAEPLIPDSDDIVPWTLIPDVPSSADEYALQTEAFCGVLAEVSLDA